MTQYVAEFYAGIPADGDTPIWSVPVSASGVTEASDKAAVKAEKAGLSSHNYMLVRRA